ncbi:hypothetical protein GS458_3002 [Geobacillus stearothermophilus]|nr:hypothetical protein GS458_3002 [Geobacillus stearothermophilus]
MKILLFDDRVRKQRIHGRNAAVFRENPTLVSGDFHARVEGKTLPMDLFCKLYSDSSKDMKIYLLLWILVKNFCSISNRVPIEKAEDKQTPLV